MQSKFFLHLNAKPAAMQKQTSIYIPKPCHENWNKMTTAQQGKFCLACSKQVVDFSLMSDTQVLKYLAGQSGKICGRFDAAQLERPLVKTKIKKKKSWWMAAFMPLLLIDNKYHSNNIPISKTDTTIHSFDERVTMGVVLENLSMPSSIKGKVIDENGNPLPYVTIMEKDTQNGTVSDSAGNFSINLHPGVDSVTLVASYVGYESVEKNISVNNADNISVEMCLHEYVTTGLMEIVVGKIAPVESNLSIDTVVTAIKKACGISGFKMYPNPAAQNSVIHLEIKQAGEYQLQLFDNQSRLVTVSNLNIVAKKSIVDFILPSDINSGVYYLRLINEQTKKYYTQKLIVQ